MLKKQRKKLKNNFYNNKDHVSKKTALLVAGENASSKLEKAKKLDIEIITEDQLQQRIS